MTRDLRGGSGARDLELCDRHIQAGNETVVATGLDANGVLQQQSSLETQLQTTLNLVPAYAWYGFGRERIRIETLSVVNHSCGSKSEVIYGNE
jgi:hypothetical protein